MPHCPMPLLGQVRLPKQARPRYGHSARPPSSAHVRQLCRFSVAAIQRALRFTADSCGWALPGAAPAGGGSGGATEAPRRPDPFTAAAGSPVRRAGLGICPPFLIRSERAGRPACWLSGSFLRVPEAWGGRQMRRSEDPGTPGCDLQRDKRGAGGTMRTLGHARALLSGSRNWR